jgi:hypothetical protein
MTPSLHILPIELVYRILDNLDELTILLTCRNVCTKLNVITDTYYRYPVLLLLLWSLIFIVFEASFFSDFSTFIVSFAPDYKEIAFIDYSILYLAASYQWRTMSSFLLSSYFTQTFTILDLTDNKIGSQGAEHLPNALLENKVTFYLPRPLQILPLAHYFTQTLTTLGLGSTEIGDQGVEHLSITLLQNKVAPCHRLLRLMWPLLVIPHRQSPHWTSHRMESVP